MSLRPRSNEERSMEQGMAQTEPDYWYVTDLEGMKFFRDENRITSAEWRSGGPKDKVEALRRDLADHPDIKEAPFT